MRKGRKEAENDEEKRVEGKSRRVRKKKWKKKNTREGGWKRDREWMRRRERVEGGGGLW